MIEVRTLAETDKHVTLGEYKEYLRNITGLEYGKDVFFQLNDIKLFDDNYVMTSDKEEWATYKYVYPQGPDRLKQRLASITKF